MHHANISWSNLNWIRATDQPREQNSRTSAVLTLITPTAQGLLLFTNSFLYGLLRNFHHATTYFDQQADDRLAESEPNKVGRGRQSTTTLVRTLRMFSLRELVWSSEGADTLSNANGARATRLLNELASRRFCIYYAGRYGNTRRPHR